MDSRIFIAKCCQYEGNTVYRHLVNYFENFWGSGRSISAGMKVLIKPNLCLPQPPEKAIISHPIILEQLVGLLTDIGAIVSIGDNPIGNVNTKVVERIWEFSGIVDIAKKYNCEYSLLEKEGYKKEVVVINGNSVEYWVSKEYLNADFVINVPKFKTHALMGFTGAVKNIYGIIPGRSKTRLHGLAPSIEEFSQVIVNVYSHRIPELTVMDGILAMEGDGPGIKGTPRGLGLLMISNDGVLIDSISTQIMGLNVEDIFSNTEAKNRGLGVLETSNVYLDGFENIQSAFVENYMMPTTMQFKNAKVIKKLFEVAKFSLSIDIKNCQACNLCIENCPVDAIENEKEGMTVIQKKCIQCLCCLEVCPHKAVEATRNKFYDALKSINKRKQNKKSRRFRKKNFQVVIIDNYDSFTYNLYQYIGELTNRISVFRSNKITLEEIEVLNPDYIVISPGSKTPSSAGISVEIVKKFGEQIPILGVCLGHQCINEAFGGKTCGAFQLFHGKTSAIITDQKTIFRKLPKSFAVARYHSLVADKNFLPPELEISATTEDGVIMGIRHLNFPVEGVQFHPESFLTQYGHEMIKNFFSEY